MNTNETIQNLITEVAAEIAQEYNNTYMCGQVSRVELVERIKAYLQTLRNPMFDETVIILTYMTEVEHLDMHTQIRATAVKMREVKDNILREQVDEELEDEELEDEYSPELNVRELALEFVELQRNPGSTTVAILLNWNSLINKCEKRLPGTDATKVQISLARSAWYGINARAVTDWGTKLKGQAKREMVRTIDSIITSVVI